MRDMVIRKTLAQDIESFKNEGQFLSWFINDAAAIKAAAMLLPVLITYSFMVVALIGLGFFQNFITGLLMMVTVSISVLLTLLFKKRLSQLGVDISDIKNSRTSKLNNWLQGQDIFLLSTKFSAFKWLIVASLKFFDKRQLGSETKKYFLESLSTLVPKLLEILLIFIVGGLVYLGFLPIGAFFSVFFLYSLLYSALNNVRANLVGLFSSVKLAKRFEFEPQQDPKLLPEFQTLTLKNVSLSFSDTSIFKRLNLAFKNTEKYAIVGRSGVGKTSLIKLLLKSLTATEGRIYYNGLNYSDISPNSLVSKFCFISTDFGVFSASLRENLTLFNSEIPTEKIEKFLKLFKLEHIQLDTKINSRSISKGEAQRIALIRPLLLGNYEVFLFDEAFSNLDKENELVAERVFLADPKKTVINITHHLDNPQLYTKVINLEELGDV